MNNYVYLVSSVLQGGQIQGLQHNNQYVHDILLSMHYHNYVTSIIIHVHVVHLSTTTIILLYTLIIFGVFLNRSDCSDQSPIPDHLHPGS